MIHAVLLKPNPEHAGLLKEGPCGSRPPMAIPVLCECRDLWVSPEVARTGCCPECGRPFLHRCPVDLCPASHALALAWERETLDDGLVRLDGPMGELGVAISYVLTGVDDGASIIEATEEWGTIVLLDEHGKEVAR